MKKRFKHLRERKGFSLIEVLVVLVIIATISVIAFGSAGSGRDTASETATQSDLRTYQGAIQQMLIQHPEIMRFNPTKPSDAVGVIIGYLNEQLEDQWKFEKLSDATASGGVAGTAVKRDAWGNPYGLYIYLDDKTTSYTDADGDALKETDSCVYIVVASAGKNGVGGPVGKDGNNYDAETQKLISAAAMVNNTDGIDDLGVIVRILNGDVFTANFGIDKATLGTLKGVQWIFGVPSTTGGINYDFVSGSVKTASTAGSLDKYYDAQAIKSDNRTLVGSWN